MTTLNEPAVESPFEEGSVFERWLKTSNLETLLKKEGGSQQCSIYKVQSELFLAKTPDGKPLCLLELVRDLEKGIEEKKMLLPSLPSLKIPGYVVLYEKSGRSPNRPIINFHVKKYTPIERFVGSFCPSRFTAFLASTINICKRKNKEDR